MLSRAHITVATRAVSMQRGGHFALALAPVSARSQPQTPPISRIWIPVTAASGCRGPLSRSIRGVHTRSLLLSHPVPTERPRKKGGDDDGSSSGSGRSGASDLFDVAPDGPMPHGRLRRAGFRARITTRYLVFGGLVLTMSASALFLAEFYFFNPEEEVRARTTRLLVANPTALQVIGHHMRDVTLQHMGSRRMQAVHRFPWVGAHVVSMGYVMQGTRGRAQVYVEWMKDGKNWTLHYLALDSGKYGTHVLHDMRNVKKK